MRISSCVVEGKSTAIIIVHVADKPVFITTCSNGITISEEGLDLFCFYVNEMEKYKILGLRPEGTFYDFSIVAYHASICR